MPVPISLTTTVYNRQRSLYATHQSILAQTSQSPIPRRCFSYSLIRSICAFLAGLPLLGAAIATPTLAQISPASDGTGTLVNTTGNQFDITGGQTSSNGANLFHSFSQFDLNTGQIANFQPNSSIQTILSRVVSGNPSTINGLIQVSGSQANLYLINPAGIIFGSNASLNVPASFVATTATSIGMGNNWFNAAGNNDYAQLNDTPNGFAFTTSQPGSIINSGNLAVGTGNDLMLVGGTVVSTGQLHAATGKIRVASVPGGSFVRLSQPGAVLSLEVSLPASNTNSPTQWTLPVLSLPQLLTGGNAGNATGLSVNSAGQVVLTGSGISVDNGDVVVREVNAREATLAASRNLTLVESRLTTTGDLNLLARDTVRVRDSATSPFIARAGGKLSVQGDRNVDFFALNHTASGFFSGEDMVVRSTNTVGGDAHYSSGGNFRIETLDGSLGNWQSPFDPVIRASGDVTFASYTGASLHILAGGSVTITGNVTITGPDTLANSLVENVTLSDGVTVVAINGNAQPTLDIRAGTTAFGTPGIIGGIGGFTPGAPGTGGTGTSANITVGSITNNGGVIFLTNQYLPNTSLPGGTISTGQILGVTSSVTIDSRNAIAIGSAAAPAGINTSTAIGNGGDIRLISGAGNINVTGLLTAGAGSGGGTANAGDIFITTRAGSIQLQNIQQGIAAAADGEAGDVTLNATGGGITTGSVQARAAGGGIGVTGNGGTITFNATGDITTGEILTSVEGARTTGNGGAISLSSSGGSIQVLPGAAISSSSVSGTGGDITFTANTRITAGNIDSNGQLGGGNVSFSANANITTANINSTGQLGGGTITLNSTAGAINTSAGELSSFSGGGNAGDITLSAFGDITTADLASSGGFTSGDGLSGDVTLTSARGRINTSAGEINAGLTSNNPGNITLSAFDTITTGGLTSVTYGFNTRNIAIASSNGSIITTAPIDARNFGAATGNNPGTVTLNAGTGQIILDSDINADNGGSINFIGNVSLTQPTTTLTTSGATNSGNITFNNLLDGSTPTTQNLILNSGTGTVTFNGIGNSVPLGNLAINGTGNVRLAGNYIFPNGYTFDNPINLIGNTTINTPNTLAFNNTLSAAANNLTLTANEINFTTAVSGTGNLTLQPFTATQTIALGATTDSSTETLDLTATDLTALQNGFNAIAIGGANSSGIITVINPVTFSDPVTIQAPVGSGSITATGAITGLDNASITLRANQTITTSNITANPGITLISNNGTIDTSAGILDSSSTSNPGGVISLVAAGNITTNTITSRSTTAAGGDITLNSQTGVISSGNLDASGNTRGGNITVLAREEITTKEINSSALTGDAGNVILDPIGDIQVDFINAQGGSSGRGGTVDITTNRFFRAVRNFSDRNGINASISTTGGTGGGDIIIRHDGGARDIPFNVGNANTNGTAGAITTGSTNSILPVQSFPGAYTQGNISIITQNPPPTPPPTPSPTPSPQPSTDGISKDIQGEVLVDRGIDTISVTARILLNTTAIVRQDIDQAIASGQIEKAIALIEQLRMQEFQNYFEGNLTGETNQFASLEQTQTILSNIAESTGTTPAVIYVFTQPEQLQLILVTPKDKPTLKTVYDANRETLLKTASTFRTDINEPRKKTAYQATAKQLYQWLIAPIEAELKAKQIDTLIFSMDTGLRSIPLAALYDGEQFLVEKYSIGVIPSINLTDTRYRDVKTTEVLAMGASKFTEQNPLPAVPIELATIVGNQNLAAENRELLPANSSSMFSQGLWSGKSFLNQGFTLTNLKSQRAQTPFGVIHLATHGQFNLGAPRNSYIQLWDTQLRLDQLRQMGWNNPPVELLVLSACRTALGNEDAEFGFGGLAVAAGVKSAIASLWYVSDEGTLGLITEFYQRLKTAPIKAEALRQAQVALIKGQVRIEGGQLRGTMAGGAISLPPELAQIGDKEFSHPYYWSAFTMIGSPW
jgi:filamentous hemagglutinin family protein